MATTTDLRRKLGLELSHDRDNAKDSYSRALAAVSAVLDDEDYEACAAWFDYGYERGKSGLEIGVHLRLLTPKGVITLDHDFSFDGYPESRFIPWSQVTQMNVIAGPLEAPRREVIHNSWLETTVGRVEFAGARSASERTDLVRTARRYLR